MRLPDGHPLASLALDTGYAIKESPAQFNVTVPENLTGNISSLPDLYSALMPDDAPQGFKPLRQVIPPTKGRAQPHLIESHVKAAVARKWKSLQRGEFLGQSLAICGGGPSLGHTLYELSYLQKQGAKVLTINRTHDFLVNLPKTHGIPWIKPWGAMLLESIPHAANYISPIGGVRYYIASQCHPQTFDKFERYDHRIWHCECSTDIKPFIPANDLPLMIPANSSTCGMRGIIKAWLQGFGVPTPKNPEAALHLFGFDSCYSTDDIESGKLDANAEPRLHAYRKPEAIHDVRYMLVKGWADGKDRHYWGNGNMLSQADEFKKFILQRKDALRRGLIQEFPIVVHGFGVIPDIAREEGLHFDQWRFNPFNRQTARRTA